MIPPHVIFEFRRSLLHFITPKLVAKFFFPRGLIKNLGPQERNCAKIPNACEGGVRSPSLTALEYLNNRAAKSAAANELFLVPERRNVVAGTELQEVG